MMMHLLLASMLFGSANKAANGLHVIQQGETLWEISKKYQILLERLIASNPQIKNPDMIFPGQVIIIP